MALGSFEHNFHDGGLIGFSVGPRRELQLDVAVDPVWNKGREAVRVRFGAIVNFEQVTAFFDTLPPPRVFGAYIARIDRLKFDTRKPCRVILELDGIGQIVIESSHVTER